MNDSILFPLTFKLVRPVNNEVADHQTNLFSTIVKPLLQFNGIKYNDYHFIKQTLIDLVSFVNANNPTKTITHLRMHLTQIDSTIGPQFYLDNANAVHIYFSFIHRVDDNEVYVLSLDGSEGGNKYFDLHKEVNGGNRYDLTHDQRELFDNKRAASLDVYINSLGQTYEVAGAVFPTPSNTIKVYSEINELNTFLSHANPNFEEVKIVLGLMDKNKDGGYPILEGKDKYINMMFYRCDMKSVRLSPIGNGEVGESHDLNDACPPGNCW